MRILYFYQYFGTPKGCWSTRVYGFARRWVEAGESVTVITSLYDKSDLKGKSIVSKCVIDGIKVVLINVKLSNKDGFFKRLYSFCLYSLIASWYALSHPCDVVVASSGPLTVGFPGLLAKYFRRKPFFFEVRDLWPEGAIQLGVLKNSLLIWLARQFEKRCYKASTAVVTLSEGMSEWINTRYGRQNTVVVPNASENSLFSSAATPPNLPSWVAGKKLVLYTGTLGLIDDCSQIIEMAEELQEQNVNDIEIVLIGEGRERSYLEDLSRTKRLNNVHFLGLMPKKEVADWLRESSCTLLVTKNVSFLNTCSPNKMYDSFAAGRPVVQTTQGWIKKLIDEKRCGINVAPNDRVQLAQAVTRICHNRSLSRELGKNAKSVALELFDVDLLARKMLWVLKNGDNDRAVEVHFD